MISTRLAVALACVLALTACTPEKPIEQPVSPEEYSRFEVIPTSLGDPALLRHIVNSVEAGLVDAVDDQEQFVENVQAIYYSKEYLEEVAYNSQANIYFGYTLAQVEEQFEGQKYVFAPNSQGTTIAKPFEEYDDTYDQIIRNVAIGGGVILLLVTVAVVTPATGATAAFSVFFAVSAKSAAVFASSDALLSAVVTAVVTGIQTGDLEQALKEAGLASSEGFLWGAIGGALVGGLAALAFLRSLAKGGLTLNKVVQAQRAGFSQSTIKMMRNGKELDIYMKAGLKGRCNVRSKNDLLRPINLRHKGPDGRTNLARMKDGHAPLDPDNVPYELHHIGQKSDSPLAVLRRQEHRGPGNDKILHPNTKASEVEHGSRWQKQREAFWVDFAAQAGSGMLAACLA